MKLLAKLVMANQLLPFAVMPSASSKNPSMTTQLPNIEGQDPLKVVVSMMEKKIRNLEKRKTKLVSYTQDGKVLVEKEQEDAVKNLEHVEHNLELSKEFLNMFKQLELEYAKVQKKEQKRARLELKEKSIEERRHLVTQVLEVQFLLEGFDDQVKEHFLNGTNGAVKLTDSDLSNLDGIYRLISPNEGDDSLAPTKLISDSAEHLNNLIDEKDKSVLGTTYKDIFALIKKIKECKYFEKKDDEPAKEEKTTAVEEEPSDPIKSSGEEASAEPEGAFTSDVRGAEVYQEVPSDHQVPAETSQAQSPVNGVDLPSDFSEATADPSLNFMGESEVEAQDPPAEEGKLNAASPEFIPRSLQGGPTQDMAGGTPPSQWEESETTAPVDSQTGEWHDVHQQHPGGRPRDFKNRGRDRGGFRGGRDGGRGGRGRGGYGQNGPHYYRQDRQDNYRRDGGRGGSRGGNSRGGRGGRGGPREPRGGQRGGFNRPQQQQ